MLLTLGLLVKPAYAIEADRLTEETARLLEKMEISELQQHTQEIDLGEILLRAVRGEEVLKPEDVLEECSVAVLGEIKESFSVLLRMTGCGILCAGLVQLCPQSDVRDICEIASTLCIALTALERFRELMLTVQQTVQRMTDFSEALTPTLLALLTACGGTRSAAGMQRLTLAVTGGLSGSIGGAAFALLKGAAAFTVTDALAEQARIGKVAQLLRSILHFAVGAGFTVLMGCLAVQGSGSAHYDSIALRAAKFAVDKSIPIVGGVFKDSADTLIGCALIVKSAVGISGLIAVGAMTLLPALQATVLLFVFRVSAALLEPFSAMRAVKLVSGMGNLLVTLLVLLLGAAVLHLMLLAALMHIGVGFG